MQRERGGDIVLHISYINTASPIIFHYLTMHNIFSTYYRVPLVNLQKEARLRMTKRCDIKEVSSNEEK